MQPPEVTLARVSFTIWECKRSWDRYLQWKRFFVLSFVCSYFCSFVHSFIHLVVQSASQQSVSEPTVKQSLTNWSLGFIFDALNSGGDVEKITMLLFKIQSRIHMAFHGVNPCTFVSILLRYCGSDIFQHDSTRTLPSSDLVCRYLWQSRFKTPDLWFHKCTLLWQTDNVRMHYQLKQSWFKSIDPFQLFLSNWKCE